MSRPRSVGPIAGPGQGTARANIVLHYVSAHGPTGLVGIWSGRAWAQFSSVGLSSAQPGTWLVNLEGVLCLHINVFTLSEVQIFTFTLQEKFKS
jgi:hypothetical protein